MTNVAVAKVDRIVELLHTSNLPGSPPNCPHASTRTAALPLVLELLERARSPVAQQLS